MTSEAVVKHMMEYIEEHSDEVDYAIETCETISPETLAILAYEALHHLMAMAVFKSREGGRLITFYLDEEDFDEIKKRNFEILFTGHDLLEAVPVAYDRLRQKYHIKE